MRGPVVPPNYRNKMLPSFPSGCWLIAAAIISTFVVAYMIEEKEWKVYRNNSSLALCDPQVTIAT